jgi:hypothetical protein
MRIKIRKRMKSTIRIKSRMLMLTSQDRDPIELSYVGDQIGTSVRNPTFPPEYREGLVSACWIRQVRRIGFQPVIQVKNLTYS